MRETTSDYRQCARYTTLLDFIANPNEWFRQVEFLVEGKVSREPVRYVRNIFKYYIAYKRIRERQLEQQASKEKM